jgi:hypothetical protein
MPDYDLAPIVKQMEYSSRLEFLYRSVDDTQNTIRFIDTKAAFCVTLLSGMTAGVLQRGHGAHGHLFLVFMAAVAVSLVLCLRVIFPVIKPHSAPSADPARRPPKFFISHHAAHHWLRHTFSNMVDNVLSEDHDSYTAAVRDASDDDILTAMCDEVLMISLIRQIKTDRLHTAMYALLGTVALFAAAMFG